MLRLVLDMMYAPALRPESWTLCSLYSVALEILQIFEAQDGHQRPV